MALNQIVVERPQDGFGAGGNVSNTESCIRIYTPLDATRYAVWQLHRASGYWHGYQLTYLGVGPCYAAKIFGSGYNAAQLSYPDGAWGTPSTVWQCVRLYVNNSTNRLRWTADAAYKWLLVACNGWSTGCVDLGVSVASGAATIVRPVLPLNNVPDSPWRDWGGVVRVAVGMPNYVVCARDIEAGTQIDIRPVTGTGQAFVHALIGVKSQLGDPSAADNMVLVPPLVYRGDVGQDGRYLMQVGEGATPTEKGVTLAPALQYGATPVAYWGTPQHCTSAANQMIASATTFLEMTDANPDGAAWNPAVGARTAMRAWQVNVEGVATINSQDCGRYFETWTFTPSGCRWTWSIVWNATAAANVTSRALGYSAMLPLDDGAGYCWVPGSSAAPLRLDSDANRWTNFNGDEALVYGGTFGDVVLRFRPVTGRVAGRGQLAMYERSVPDAKLYAKQLYNVAGVPVTDREVWCGGAEVGVFPSAAAAAPYMRGGGGLVGV